ncbi:hypothetical protein GLYMA_11G023100v4 [Glycine max]|uniref:Uncharacterized protein n=1 Tax=Glycine max TaxID=3847 RepID=K7LMN5_SOYBN|nr:hypothetical protein JHK87_029746 [Glycine soja]KAG4987489.1 hypothetical protein JHK85_030472 [Glycine max]KAG4993115.1 hypothetical protein JHK86_029942 [Glycine max]KAH1157190.1 hypothetical protein GYH30_029798 [Glycine max]KRH27917.1 hypothetical protein GLYMA_11G023100v4 [Glycine max]
MTWKLQTNFGLHSLYIPWVHKDGAKSSILEWMPLGICNFSLSLIKNIFYFGIFGKCTLNLVRSLCYLIILAENSGGAKSLSVQKTKICCTDG